MLSVLMLSQHSCLFLFVSVSVFVQPHFCAYVKCIEWCHPCPIGTGSALFKSFDYYYKSQSSGAVSKKRGASLGLAHSPSVPNSVIVPTVSVDVT